MSGSARWLDLEVGDALLMTDPQLHLAVVLGIEERFMRIVYMNLATDDVDQVMWDRSRHDVERYGWMLVGRCRR